MTDKLAGKSLSLPAAAPALALALPSVSRKKGRVCPLPARVNPGWMRQSSRSGAMARRSKAIPPTSPTSTAYLQKSRRKPGALSGGGQCRNLRHRTVQKALPVLTRGASVILTHRLDGVDQGLPFLLGVQCFKGGSTLISAQLDRRSRGETGRLSASDAADFVIDEATASLKDVIVK